MTPDKIKQQKILAYILLGCSAILIPTKTAIGSIFLVIAVLTLRQVKLSETNSD